MQKTRLDESRARLHKAFLVALGSYTEQEATKLDLWRDCSLGQLYDHLKHEVDEEIRGNLRRSELSYLVHNAMDAVTLSAMLLDRALEIAGVDVSA